MCYQRVSHVISVISKARLSIDPARNKLECILSLKYQGPYSKRFLKKNREKIKQKVGKTCFHVPMFFLKIQNLFSIDVSRLSRKEVVPSLIALMKQDNHG